MKTFRSLLLASVAAAVYAAPAGAQTGVQFDGTNDYVTFGAAPALGTAQFTLEVWFKRTGIGVATTTGTGGVTSAIPLLTKGRGEAEGSNVDMNYFLGLRSTDSVLVADYEEGAGQLSPGLNHPVVGVTPVRSHVWYHAAVTFDGTTLNLYLNGNLESTVAVGAGRLPRFDSIQHAGLGSAMTSTGLAAGFFAGTLDEARIWNVARTQPDIQSTITSELPSGAGLIGRWGLNDGSGTTALNSIGGAPNGTLTNGPTWVTGSSFSLDYGLFMAGTNGFVTFGNHAALGLPAFTLETWFRRDAAGVATSTGTGGVTAVPLIAKGRAEADGTTADMNYFLGIRPADNLLVADFEEGAAGTSPGLNHPIAGVTPILANGAWHHAAVSYDGATWNLYLDGVLEATLAVGQPVQSASIQHASIGSALTSAGTAAGFFAGAMDEARVWNVARTQGQLQSAINTPLSGPQATLVARWGMNEAAGLSTLNSAGGVVTGTLTGTGVNWTHGAPFNLTSAPPLDPSGLVAAALAYNTVQLTWADNSTDETSFEIERSTSGPGGPFSPLTSVSANIVSALDAPLTAASSYCYRVRAVNGVGASGFTNAECATTPAESNQALDFSAAGTHVALGIAPSLNAAQFTVECWFRRDGAGTGTNSGAGGIPDVIPLVAKGRAESETANADINYMMGLRASDGVLCADFEEAQSGATPGLNHPLAGVTPIAADGVWHHAAVTYDGNELRLFLDGCPEASLAIGQPANSVNVAHASIGTAMTTAGVAAGNFDGAIDEVRIWSAARTIAELQAGMGGELSGPVAGLLCRWGLNETLGTIAYASTGGVNGTLVGAAFTRVGGTPFGDPLAPSATVLSPNGGEHFAIGGSIHLTWSAADCFGVATVDLLISHTGFAGPFTSIAIGIPNDGDFLWTVTGPEADSLAVLRVVAHDGAGHDGLDESDTAFTIFDLATPTLLALFTADASAQGIRVRWQFGPGTPIVSQRIEHAARPQGPWTLLDVAVTRTGELLEMLDTQALDGAPHWYRLIVESTDGTQVFGPVGTTAIRPILALALGAPTPNPAPGGFRVELALPVATRVRLTLHDVAGRSVATLHDGWLASGRHPLAFDRQTLGRLPAGLYLMRLDAGNRRITQRVVLVD
ncbi:MAG: hypothetical protein HOP12_13125 [Candidatus Eisenbacteria bacterium]|uniref:Fibronectin type-III domain-containing protein n=1 Tax=Eiseniibacteriota bacterium TaxID=2212470 RepID=A0A849SKG6_UNCEI|nr:hypothetical protein [Candidatus Eisenbacteria bacterium]